MKGRSWCKILGHDFRRYPEEHPKYSVFSTSYHCKYCGLSKKEAGIK